MNKLCTSTDEETSCENGDVRLQGGFDSSSGRVEFCIDRQWGGVCSNELDINDARVLCRQLNFDIHGMSIFQSPTS